MNIKESLNSKKIRFSLIILLSIAIINSLARGTYYFLNFLVLDSLENTPYTLKYVFLYLSLEVFSVIILLSLIFFIHKENKAGYYGAIIFMFLNIPSILIGFDFFKITSFILIVSTILLSIIPLSIGHIEQKKRVNFIIFSVTLVTLFIAYTLITGDFKGFFYFILIPLIFLFFIGRKIYPHKPTSLNILILMFSPVGVLFLILFFISLIYGSGGSAEAGAGVIAIYFYGSLALLHFICGFIYAMVYYIKKNSR